MATRLTRCGVIDFEGDGARDHSLQRGRRWPGSVVIVTIRRAPHFAGVQNFIMAVVKTDGGATGLATAR